MALIELDRQSDRFTLRPVMPFRLDLTVWALRRRSQNAVDLWNDATYSRVLALRGQPVGWLSVPLQQLLQNERFIMLLVASPVDESNGPFSGFLLEDFEYFPVMPDLTFVTRPKFFPLSWIMSKPFS